jgi:hypothetical protein
MHDFHLSRSDEHSVDNCSAESRMHLESIVLSLTKKHQKAEPIHTKIRSVLGQSP